MKHFLDGNVGSVFASCRSVWKGCSRSVTDLLVFITDFIGLNLSPVLQTNSQDEQSRAWLSLYWQRSDITGLSFVDIDHSVALPALSARKEPAQDIDCPTVFWDEMSPSRGKPSYIYLISHIMFDWNCWAYIIEKGPRKQTVGATYSEDQWKY